MGMVRGHCIGRTGIPSAELRLAAADQQQKDAVAIAVKDEKISNMAQLYTQFTTGMRHGAMMARGNLTTLMPAPPIFRAPMLPVRLHPNRLITHQPTVSLLEVLEATLRVALLSLISITFLAAARHIPM